MSLSLTIEQRYIYSIRIKSALIVPLTYVIVRISLFQLEAHLLASRNKVVNLKKDILHLTDELQKRDSEILELKEEIDILKEELILRFS